MALVFFLITLFTTIVFVVCKIGIVDKTLTIKIVVGTFILCSILMPITITLMSIDRRNLDVETKQFDYWVYSKDVTLLKAFDDNVTYITLNKGEGIGRIPYDSIPVKYMNDKITDTSGQKTRLIKTQRHYTSKYPWLFQYDDIETEFLLLVY